MRSSRILTAAVFAVTLYGAAVAADAAGGTHIRVELEHRDQLAAVSRLLSIDRVDGLVIEGEASPAQLATLTRGGYRVVELATGAQLAATPCAAGWEDDPLRDWSCYPSYPQYVAFLERLVERYPEQCRLEQIGWSTNTVRPHELLALMISDNPDFEEDEPEVFLSSSMHGDETTGWVMLMRLADELLGAYGEDATLTALVNETELWLNPLANPDGTFFGSDETVGASIRYYATTTGGVSFVDPNRNFPDPDDGDHPDGFAWWRETEAMMDFASRHSFVLSANLHGGVEVVNYPWDTWARRHVDNEWLVAVSRAYAVSAQNDGPPGYMRALDDGITNGYDWYEVAGGRQDYMTYVHGSRELTIELSDVKLLAADELPTLWQANRNALLGFIGFSLEGLRGVVHNPRGEPVAATIELLGHDVAEDRSWVTADPQVGDFHRLVLPGTYDLRVSAPGYASTEIYGIAVIAGAASRVDVTLYPETPRRAGGRRRP